VDSEAATTFTATYFFFLRGERFAAGETITMTVTAMAGSDYGFQIDGLTVATGSGVPGSVSYTFPADTTVDYVTAQNDATWTGSWACSTATDPEATIPSAEAPPIPAWVQAYGRDGRDATCEAGWDPSWQSWAEPVTGGWVCTRSIPSLG
jgi:hypothetical protein